MAKDEVRDDIFSGSLAVFQSERVASAGGQRGVWGEFRPPYKFWAKSIRIFSNAYRQEIELRIILAFAFAKKRDSKPIPLLAPVTRVYVFIQLL